MDTTTLIAIASIVTAGGAAHQAMPVQGGEVATALGLGVGRQLGAGNRHPRAGPAATGRGRWRPARRGCR